MNIGRAFTEAMQAQRARDHDHVTLSDWLGFVRVDGLLQRRRLTIEEARDSGEAA